MFDRYTAAVAPSWGRRALAIASVALHVSAAGVLVMYSVMYIEEVTPPPVSLRFFSVAPSSAPPAAGGRHKRKRDEKPITKAASPSIASRVVEPTHDEPVADSDDNAKNSDDSNVPGPAADGPGSKPTGKPGGPGERPREAAAFTLMASRIRADLPHLPEWFTAQHPKQTVRGTFRVCLDTSGHVSDVSTILSIAGNVDGVLMQQIKDSWLYKPQALPVCFAQPFSFHIN